MPSPKRLNAQYILMQVAFWAASAALCAYQVALLLERGFTNTQVGVLLAARCLAGVVAQPLLGSYADKHPHMALKYIVSICLVIAFFAGLAHMLPMGMAGTAAMLVIIGALEISAYPLMDAMAVQFIQAGKNVSYSLGRGLGSLSYALTSVLIGFQVERLGVESSLVTHSALVVLLTVTVATFPRFDPAWRRKTDKTQEKAKSAVELLRDNPRFGVMLAGILFGITAYMLLSNFMVNVIRSRGGSDAHLGIAIFITAGFELPAAVLFDRLYRRGRAGAIVMASMGFIALKGTLTLLAPTYWAVWLVQPIQLLGYGLFTPASVFYVSDAIDPADQVKGQTLMMMASNGMGGMMASALGGVVLDAGGVNAMLVMCIGMGTVAAAVTALAVFAGKRERA